MRAYSVDLRRKIVEAVWRRMSKAEAARVFGVAISSVKRYVNIARKSESLAPKKSPGKNRTLDQEHDAIGEHDGRRDGAVCSGRRYYYLSGLRGLRGAVLVPTLRPGQVVVLDNLSSHNRRRVRELVESRGCELLFLPLYSPDLNPIEEAFSKVKGLLRRTGARTREALIEAMGQALDAVTSRDARGFFEHCGYHSTAQPLCQLL
jgi:transposase